MQELRSTRRRVVGALSGVLLATLAGCNGGANGERTDPQDGADEATAEPSRTTAESATQTAASEAALDLREANVVDVAVEGDGGRYSVDVTLHHDDDGEDGYANWWQIERLDGTRLGRRELLHAHSQQPFTRSTTVDIPDDVNCVAVRGHDQTHGYGGRMLVVDLDSGETVAIDQGADRRAVDERDCP